MSGRTPPGGRFPTAGKSGTMRMRRTSPRSGSGHGTILGMEPTVISKLPDGRFTVSTDPRRALSEAEVRQEFEKTISRADIIDDIIQRARQMR
jgi:hypothetical protein